jgi:hypothetical protein
MIVQVVEMLVKDYELRSQEITEGFAEIGRGEATPWTETVMDKMSAFSAPLRNEEPCDGRRQPRAPYNT